MTYDAVLLDRDGVINVRRDDYVKCLAEFDLLPGAAAAIARLAKAGLRVAVVTNQSAVNRGLLAEDELDRIHQHLRDAVAKEGGRIEAVFVCPHRPDESCGCRKPRPGMLLRAAQELNLNLARCLLVGDAESDMAAAQSAGCAGLRIGDPGVPDLPAAVERILAG